MAIKNDNRPSAGKDRLSSNALLARIDELQDFYDFSPVGHLTLNKDGQILGANLTLNTMLKVVKKELNGQSFYEYVVQDDRDILYIHLRNLFKAKKPLSCTLRLQNANGELFHTTMESIYNEDQKGRAGCKSVIVDITKRFRMEQTLKESEERFRLMADSSADVIFQLDSKGLLRYSSPSGAKILGYTPAEVKDTLFEKYVFAPNVPKARKMFQRLTFGEKVTSFEIYLLTKSGTPVPFEVRASPLLKDEKVQFIVGVARDITERKHAEEELKKERFHLTKAQEIGRIGTWDFDMKENKLVWTEEAYRIFGVPVGKNLTYESFLDCVHPQDRAYVETKWREALKKKHYDIEHRIIVDGQIKWIREKAELVLDENGNAIQGIGSAQDITDRKRTEEQLRIINERLAAALDASGGAVYDHRIPLDASTYHDNRWAELLGYRHDELPSYERFLYWLYKRVHPEDLERLEQIYNDFIEGRIPNYYVQIRMRHKQGHWIWVEGFSNAVERDESGRVLRIVGTMTDITNRKQMEEELRKSRDELELRVQERTEALTKANEALQAEVEKRKRYEEALKDSTQKILQESSRRRFLAHRLVDTLEKDRRDIAMDLHDQIGQMLATLKMDLEIIKGDQKSGNDLNEVSERLSSANDKITTIMRCVRDVSRKLRPDILDTLGLIPALRSLLESYREEAGLRVHFYYRELSKEMEPYKSLSLYRITQEALNNVVKHAQARQVFVNLILKNHSIQLSVEDDGIGFDYSNKLTDITAQNSLGIMIMKERAMIAGGELNVESERGKGTHVVVEIPID